MVSIIDLLNSNKPDLIAGKGASLEHIDAAERELGLSFAPDYRECLLNFGLFAFNGHEMTGITNDKRTSVIEATKRQRDLNKTIDSDLYVVEEANMDGITILQKEDGTLYANYSDAGPIQIATGLAEYFGLV